MTESIFVQLEWLFRVILAGFCGALVGYERRNRGKEAGIRTHAIVALASALIMIISLYGGREGYDTSRIAAQIVSGVGFLGAGMIFVHKKMVTGLTTAAGVWATAGIGMAIGAGMYTLGVASALIIVLFQVILHKNFILNKSDHLVLGLRPNSAVLLEIRKILEENGVVIEEMELEKHTAKTEVIMTVIFSKTYSFSDFAAYCAENEDVLSISI